MRALATALRIRKRVLAERLRPLGPQAGAELSSIDSEPKLGPRVVHSLCMRALLIVLPVLLTLASCSKAEEAAKGAMVAKLAEKATGATVKSGELCPNWPKNVPVYPGSKIVACVAFNAPDGGVTESPEMQALIAQREGKPVADPGPPVTAIMTLGQDVTASTDDVVAFYKQHLTSYKFATTAGQPGMEAAQAWKNEKDLSDPVSNVLMRAPTKNADGTTSVSIMVTTVKR